MSLSPVWSAAARRRFSVAARATRVLQREAPARTAHSPRVILGGAKNLIQL